MSKEAKDQMSQDVKISHNSLTKVKEKKSSSSVHDEGAVMKGSPHVTNDNKSSSGPRLLDATEDASHSIGGKNMAELIRRAEAS